MVKSLPSLNQQTSKLSFDLMPFLFSVSSAKLPSIVRTISTSSLRRYHPPDPLQLLLSIQLDYVSQPPLQLGVAMYLSSGQWDASGRDPDTFSPAPSNLQCMLPALLLGCRQAQHFLKARAEDGRPSRQRSQGL